MRRSVIVVLLSYLILLSCRGDKKAMLVGKWHAVKLENPEMDSFFVNSQKYIDTIGKNNDEATNMMLYGVTNMDSMRQILQTQYDSAKAMQAGAVANTTFQFRKDSVVVLSFNGSIDSSKWYFDKNGSLVLDELNNKNSPDKVTMEVIALSRAELKLKFVENNAYSTVTFQPEGK